ncbi:MAG: response regulator [Deltaproteobacteria bacterium]|nr:response regulator [Deltaproteobacteria bacterium]
MASESTSKQKEDDPTGLLHGAEVLLVDNDARVREGFRKLLGAAGLMVTAIADADSALELAREKHFAVAIVDVDTPEVDKGYDLLGRLTEGSPATALILLTARQTFSAAVQGFRRGAVDVVAKSPENVKYLTESVRRHCEEHRQNASREALFSEVLEIHEDFLKRLMDASRSQAEAQEQAQGSSSETALEKCDLLVVDANPNTAEGLGHGLSDDYRVVGVQTGGEALDYGGQHSFQLALVAADLPDLPSSMVAKSLRAELSDAIVLLFSHPEPDKPGRADIIEATQSIELIDELKDGSQLVEHIHELREAYIAKARERRYLKIFRRDHYDFLRRYVELKQKLTAPRPDSHR